MEGAVFPDAVRRTAARYGMDLGQPLVMVSGGPDSVALLRVVLDLGGEPAALHVDHGLREESPEDAGFVRGLCDRLSVRCEVRRPRLEKGANLQERARRERYRLAEEVACGLGLRIIATGHNVAASALKDSLENISCSCFLPTGSSKVQLQQLQLLFANG